LKSKVAEDKRLMDAPQKRNLAGKPTQTVKLSLVWKISGKKLGSAAMNADAKQTDFYVYLSGVLLAGLLLNTALGWWWANPTALIMVPIITKEGVEGLKGKVCDDCSATVA
jgi:hypothetical protein